jgi:putative phosphoribosyl transferase
VAVPVGAHDSCEEFGGVVDEVVCAEKPEPFQAVGQWYDEFPQTTDAEVRELLERAHAERAKTSRSKRNTGDRADRRTGEARYSERQG